MTTAPVTLYDRIYSWSQIVAVAYVACSESRILFSTVKQAIGWFRPDDIQQAIGWFRPDDIQRVTGGFSPDEANALNELRQLANGKDFRWIVVDRTGDFSIPYPVNAAVYGTPKIVIPRRLLQSDVDTKNLASFWVHHAIAKIELNNYFWTRTVGLITFIATAILLSKTYPFWLMCWIAHAIQGLSSIVVKAGCDFVAFDRTLTRTTDAMKTQALEFLERFEERRAQLLPTNEHSRHERYEQFASNKIRELQENLAHQG